MNFTSVPAYSFGKRYANKDKEDIANIGPGMYNQDKAYDRTKGVNIGYKFSKSNPNNKLNSNNIGPGNYNTNISSFNKNGWTFQSRHQNYNQEKNQNIGPGMYNINRNMNNKGYSIPKGKDHNYNNNNPGIGNYNLNKENDISLLIRIL